MKQLLSLFVVLLAAGCEVLEEDISDSKVRIIAPYDHADLAPGSIGFRWFAVEHAAGYEFTLVTPSLAAAERIVADTVIYADTLARHYGCRITLPQGTYTWYVRAFNGGYTTPPAMRSLTVMAAETTETPEIPEP